jgi:hypothetical protein
MSTPFVKMNAYLKKITKETGIEINLQRIMGLDLRKINKHFLQIPIKVGHYRINCLPHDKLIYHKNLFDFFPWYVMLVCTASYMMAGYGHARHIF